MNRKTDPVDEQIGLRIKERRRLLGFSTHQLAGFLGISYQQLYKYENGKNRVSSAQLAKMARLLNVDLDYFFNGQNAYLLHPEKTDSFNAARLANEPDTMKLVKSYISISDPRTRGAVVELVTSITKYLGKRPA